MTSAAIRKKTGVGKQIDGKEGGKRSHTNLGLLVGTMAVVNIFQLGNLH